MALLKIIKLSTKTWKHNSDVDGDFILTKFYAKQEDNDFLLVETYGAKRRKYKINEIQVYDIGGSAETFADFDALFLRLEVLKYPAFYVDGEFTFNPASYDLSEFQNAETDKFVKESEVLSNDISTYTPATTPLSGTELALIDDGTGFKKVAVSEFGGGSSSLRKQSYCLIRDWSTPTLDRFYYIGFNNLAIEFRPVGTNNTIIDSLTGRNVGMFTAPYNCKVVGWQMDMRNTGSFTGIFGIGSGQIASGLATDMTNKIVHLSQAITSAGFVTNQYSGTIVGGSTILKGETVCVGLMFSAQASGTKNGVTIQLHIEEV